MNHQRKTEYDPQSPWGKWVLAVLDKHKLGFRQQRQRTGIPHATIVNWAQDAHPQMDLVVKFARGMGEDVNEALQIAGYPPLDEEEASVGQPTVYEAIEVLGQAHRGGTLGPEQRDLLLRTLGLDPETGEHSLD